MIMSSHSDHQRREAFARALARLPDTEREIFRLHPAEKLSDEGVALRLNLPRQVVERGLASALKRLYRSIERGNRPWWMFW
jgi:RNA polymerase sigma factor (sigma-70 family)